MYNWALNLCQLSEFKWLFLLFLVDHYFNFFLEHVGELCIIILHQLCMCESSVMVFTFAMKCNSFVYFKRITQRVIDYIKKKMKSRLSKIKTIQIWISKMDMTFILT